MVIFQKINYFLKKTIHTLCGSLFHAFTLESNSLMILPLGDISILELTFDYFAM
jgi:hypothetical protein